MSRKEMEENTSPANRLASQAQSTRQPQPVCTWSAHAPQSGQSPSPFPRHSHTLTATTTASGEVFLFGGYVYGSPSNDLYVISTRDFSAALLQTSGKVPAPRYGHVAALTSTSLLICGGTDDNYQNVLNDSLYLLNLVSREWTRVVVNGPGGGSCRHHTATVVGSKLFVFGGRIGGKVVNDMWTLDLNCLKSQPFWESYEPTHGNEKPPSRRNHVSVAIEGHIIIFGGWGGGDYLNDTWSFDTSTRKWTELRCIGSIPSPRRSHTAVLVDDVMYVFGGYTGKIYLDDLYALQLSTRRWFKFYTEGSSPHGRSHHAMACDGTRVFVLGGISNTLRPDEMSLIHVFDTKEIKYPNPKPNATYPNEKTTELARKSSAGPRTQEEPQHPEPSSSDAHGYFPLRDATPATSGRSASPQITDKRNTGPNDLPPKPSGLNSMPRRVPEDDVSERSTVDHAKLVAPHSSSKGEVGILEYEGIMRLERQLSASLTAQNERDQQITQLTAKLAVKSALLEQSEANAVKAAETADRTGLELREHADQLLMQTSLVKQRDVELRYMQAKLDQQSQQIGKHEKELANMRAKFEAKESDLEAVRLRLTDAEKDLIKYKTEADTLRAQPATTGPSTVNRDEGQVARRLMERMRAIEAEMTSKQSNEKSIENMECSNEG